MIKKIIFILILNICLFLNISFANNNIFEINIKVNKETELERKVIFKYLSQKILNNIPKSYKYINLNFTDLKKDDESYEHIQKIVRSDLIENKKIKLNLKSKLNSYYFYSLLEKQTWYDFVNAKNYEKLKSKNVTDADLIFVNSILENIKGTNKSLLNIFENYEKFKIFEDVYNTIISDHYDKDKINKNDLIYSSISWLAEWSWDKFTTYFPPVESNNFEENLSWEFEWIWAYIDMENHWEVKIISPIVWSPSERAWIKWWDIIKKVNWTEITKTMTLKQVVNMIKWPAWTKVILEIQRWREKLIFEVIREKIVLNDVEYKIIDWNYFYIQIKMFWDKVFDQILSSINELKKHSNINNIIIDLRNNSWWYLDKVVNILSLFIQKWEPVVVVKYKDNTFVYNSYWYNKLNLWDYKIYILVNSWTASASEILAWSLKDYFPDIKIIWENTYWKWSVQTLKYYIDWSSLKYTIAKWYTWKNIIWIDWVWISPDIKVDLDIEKFKSWIDTQLNFILNWLK